MTFVSLVFTFLTHVICTIYIYQSPDECAKWIRANPATAPLTYDAPLADWLMLLSNPLSHFFAVFRTAFL